VRQPGYSVNCHRLERLATFGGLSRQNFHEGGPSVNTRRKELTSQYQERKITGGVYLIENTRGGQSLLEATTDIRGSKNRFDFSQKTNSCVNLKLRRDWEKDGPDAFVFQVLEEHVKGETQTMKEFEADIAVLKDLWLEKFSMEDIKETVI
jgi:hypothetical protein